MNILNIEHISKTFGNKVIFDDICYGIQEGDKIGIVGMNGAGKSTLLKTIAGLEMPDEGKITRMNSLKISYLQQNPEYQEDDDILSYVLGDMTEADWSLESEAKSMLNRMGITDYSQKMSVLSGGQRKRAALVKTLLSSFDVLMMDEPTNHLDEEMVTWLEDYLGRFRGVLILVTHDRYFLDKVTNKILEISHGKIYGYEANYSGFLELKAQREEMELATERKHRSVLRMELEWAKRGCRARTTKQKARLERLETLKNGTAPLTDQNVEISSVETRMGKKTIELHHVSKSYGEREIINDFDYIVLRNQRLGIIGPNGCGKSTLMKIIAGVVQPDEGYVEIGDTIKIGYFAQEEKEMNPNQRVIDYIRDIAEYVPTKDGRLTASQLLERFLFDGNMQYSPIGKLSGGEKRRLYLLSVLAKGANVLLFDEPGNNLDIPTLTILEDYLNSFSGIVITVSHDRYFLDNVVDRIFAFEENGILVQYEGGYTDYLKAKKRFREDKTYLESEKTSGSGMGRTGQSKKKAYSNDRKQNRPVKLKFTYKEQKEFESIDDEIAVLEQNIDRLDKEIAANATNAKKLSELMEEKEQAQVRLEEKTERWVYLNELAEKIGLL